jgi:DNA-binding transcriptional LysR family regulator
MAQSKLEKLEIFLAIVRCGGFRAAAIERGVSSSALSQALSSLEQALGMRLLNRTTRSIALTEAGEQLLRQLVPAFGDIELAIEGLNQFRDSPSGTIKINTPAPAADHLLCPLAFDFMRTHPDVKFEIIADAAVIDIVEQGFDAGVRFGKQLPQDMIAVRLGLPLRYAIVASPDYLQERGTPLTPFDLAKHNCIRRRFPGGTLVTWSFEKDGEALEIVPEGRLTLSSAHHELKAALAGQGIAHVFDDYSNAFIESGKLVEVLPDWSPILPSWYIYYPSRRHSSAAMQAFLRYVRQYDWTARSMPSAAGDVPFGPE